MIMTRVMGGMLVAMLAVPMVAGAQATAPSRTSFSVDAGISLPLGDLGDGVGTGFGVHGALWYRLTNERMRVRGDVGFDRFTGDNSINIGGVSAETNVTIIPVVGNVIYSLGQSRQTARPYVLGGAGLFVARGSSTVRVGNVTRDESETDTNLGIQVGGGIEFQLAGFSTFAEAKLVNVFGDGSARWIPLTFGIKF
jgi:opacity protein-like surface antigen